MTLSLLSGNAMGPTFNKFNEAAVDVDMPRNRKTLNEIDAENDLETFSIPRNVNINRSFFPLGMTFL